MSIKVSDLPLQTAVDLESGSLVYVVDPTTPITSYKTTLGAVKTFVTTPATASVLGAVIVGSNLTVGVDGTITVDTTAIAGSNLTVDIDGTIAVDTTTIATKTYVDNTSTDNAISFSVALG